MSKFTMENLHPKVIHNDNEVLDLNMGDFRFFNSWMSNKSTFTHVVQEHELNRLDLISFTEYQTTNLWWIIGLFNGIVKFNDLQPGVVLQIPSLSQIESYIQVVRSMKNGQSVAIRQ